MINLLTSKVDNEMAYKLHHLADDIEFLLSENRKRESHKFRNESYSQRENLVFCGFHVARDDPESCEDKVREICHPPPPRMIEGGFIFFVWVSSDTRIFSLKKKDFVAPS